MSVVRVGLGCVQGNGKAPIALSAASYATLLEDARANGPLTRGFARIDGWPGEGFEAVSGYITLLTHDMRSYRRRVMVDAQRTRWKSPRGWKKLCSVSAPISVQYRNRTDDEFRYRLYCFHDPQEVKSRDLSLFLLHVTNRAEEMGAIASLQAPGVNSRLPGGLVDPAVQAQEQQLRAPGRRAPVRLSSQSAPPTAAHNAPAARARPKQHAPTRRSAAKPPAKPVAPPAPKNTHTQRMQVTTGMDLESYSDSDADSDADDERMEAPAATTTTATTVAVPVQVGTCVTSVGESASRFASAYSAMQMDLEYGMPAWRPELDDVFLSPNPLLVESEPVGMEVEGLPMLSSLQPRRRAFADFPQRTVGDPMLGSVQHHVHRHPHPATPFGNVEPLPSIAEASAFPLLTLTEDNMPLNCTLEAIPMSMTMTPTAASTPADLFS